MSIVVAERGWIFVGHADTDGDGGIDMHDAQVVRRWGTTNGLAQLATCGPQPDTRLEGASPVRIPCRSVVVVFECDEAKWA